MIGNVVAIILVAIALWGLLAATTDLGKYRPDPVAHKLAVRIVVMWVIILIASLREVVRA